MSERTTEWIDARERKPKLSKRPECPSVPPPEVEVRCDNPVPRAAIALCFGAAVTAVCMIVALRMGWL